MDDSPDNELMHKVSDYLNQSGVAHSFSKTHIEIVCTEKCHRVYTLAPWSADPRVPVVYMSVYTEDVDKDGNTVHRLAVIEEVLRKRIVSQEFAPWLSVTNHPISGLPTLFIHPCYTTQWMNDIGDHSAQLWLQYFGRGVGLLE